MPSPRTDLPRRPWLLDAGEQLLLAPHPVELLLRFEATMRASGLPAGRLLTSPLCAVPLPLADEGLPSVRERWSGIDPAGLAVPVLWLPGRLTERRWRPDDDGRGVVVENNDAWAVRLVYEMQTAGLYDQATGTWHDPLAAAGVDIDTPDGVGRVGAWLAGGTDPALDGIEAGLADAVTDWEDPDWAVDLAVETLPRLYLNAHTLGAESLLADLDDLRSEVDAGECSSEEASAALSAVAMGGQIHFDNLPVELSAPGGESAWWQELAAEIGPSATSRESFRELLDRGSAHLQVIHDALRPELDRVPDDAGVECSDLVPVR